ncbi:MAG: hypothetical protein NT049_08580 [Planctomycetota bacterium]|nr:hypothetical protein [Planctomycetota bacterium]
MSTTQVTLKDASVTKDETTGLTEIERALVALDARGLAKEAGGNLAAILAVLSEMGGLDIAPAVAGAIGAQVITQNESTQVLAADASRERVVLTNNLDTVMYVAVGTDAVALQGIALPPHGGQLVLTPSGGCRLTINAICEGGGKALSYQTTSSS